MPTRLTDEELNRIGDTARAVVDAHRDGHSLLSGERARARDEFLRRVAADDVLAMATELHERRAADLTAAEVEALDGLRKFMHGLLAIGALDRDVRMKGAIAALDRLVKP